MGRRTVTALLLLALAIPAIMFGGIFYFAIIGFFLVVSSWEYVHMFRAAGHEPSMVVTVGGTFIIIAARAFWAGWAEPAFTVLVLLAMAFHLIAYERGHDGAALDFVITIGGLVYLGWIGAYLIDLRALPNGGWWVMFVLPIVWLADSGAYAWGARFGKNRMTPRLSPKKSWEGYWAGVFMGTVYGAFFAFAYSKFGPLHVSILQGILLGFVLSTVTTLGDLGESLFKRFSSEKDSGNLFPGHGGAFDRIDSLIWAGVIGVYWIRFFFN
ncbi:MAG TPA: phosphatidate cytidylyltransferase [Anaerolineales bacterium]|nr:phosphatidate cytidylyltransferase [Anaerolineales bacterium]